MTAWIMRKDKATYEALMNEEGKKTKVINSTETQVLVVMSDKVAEMWSSSGYWYETNF